MDIDGVAYSVLYPSFAGFSGETFGALRDPDLELACVQAYNDWLIDEWTSLQRPLHPSMHRAAGAGRSGGCGDQSRHWPRTQRRCVSRGADAFAGRSAH